MENPSKKELPMGNVLSKQMEETSNSDVPADEIEDDKKVITPKENTSDDSSDSSSSSDSDSDSEYECDICNKTFADYLPFKQHLKGKKHAKAALRKKKEKKLMKIDTSESVEEHLIEEPYAECKSCNKEFFGPESYEQHLKSKKHKQKRLEASILEQVREEGKINADKLRDLCKNKQAADNVLEAEKEMSLLTLDEEDEKSEEEFECKECEKIFSGLIPYTQHLTSKLHAKKGEKKSLLHKVIPDASKEGADAENSKHTNTLCMEDDVLVCKACSTSFSGPESAMMHIKSKKHAKNVDKYNRKLKRKQEKKQSKETYLNLSKESKVKPGHDSPDKATSEKIQSTPDGSGRSELASSSGNPSTSSSQVNESLIAYEKYKEYKKVMKSVQEDET